MRLKSFRAVAIALALATSTGLAGCSDPLAPEDVLGFYEATHIPEPDQTLRVLRPRILAVTLTIDPSQITRRIDYEITSGDGTTTLHQEVLLMAYEIDGARLRTTMLACPIEMLCATVITETPDFLFIGDQVMEVGEGGSGVTYRKAPVSALRT